jgi:hypothetical protein
LFESLNGDRVTAQLAAILDGTFEQTTCETCQAVFRPEHHMLYSQYNARVWIVMYPPADRCDFYALERSIDEVLQRNFAGAAPVVSKGLQGIKPRLVFGQHMLTEALRAAREAIDPPLLECTKMLAIRRALPEILAHGPSELAFERTTETGELQMGIHALADAARVGELVLPARLLGEARSLLGDFAGTYPDLFHQPYVSALRYLSGGQL